MENIILVVHVLIAFAIIALIMLQQGKGAEMGASFGSGSSQTVFGAAGSGNFFSRMTAVLATIFFATSFSLAIVAKNSSAIDSAGFSAPASSQSVEAEVGLESLNPEIDIDSVDAALEGGAESVTTDSLEAPAEPKNDGAQ